MGARGGGGGVWVAAAGPLAAPFELDLLSPVNLDRAARGGDPHPAPTPASRWIKNRARGPAALSFVCSGGVDVTREL